MSSLMAMLLNSPMSEPRQSIVTRRTLRRRPSASTLVVLESPLVLLRTLPTRDHPLPHRSALAIALALALGAGTVAGAANIHLPLHPNPPSAPAHMTAAALRNSHSHDHVLPAILRTWTGHCRLPLSSLSYTPQPPAASRQSTTRSPRHVSSPSCLPAMAMSGVPPRSSRTRSRTRSRSRSRTRSRSRSLSAAASPLRPVAPPTTMGARRMPSSTAWTGASKRLSACGGRLVRTLPCAPNATGATRWPARATTAIKGMVSMPDFLVSSADTKRWMVSMPDFPLFIPSDNDMVSLSDSLLSLPILVYSAIKKGK